jgi:hypothetical protein
MIHVAGAGLLPFADGRGRFRLFLESMAALAAAVDGGRSPAADREDLARA